jgi:PAS domain S-box-containing protein
MPRVVKRSALAQPEATIAATTDYQALFELLPLPAYIFDDQNLRFLAVNNAALERYGYSRNEFLMLALTDIRPTDETERLSAEIRAHGTDPIYAGTWRHKTRAGEIFRVNIVAQPIVYDRRRAHYVVVSDLTERQRMEDALAESRTRAERELRELNDQLRRVSARSRARREEDRTRLARELHDQLGQALAGLKIELFWLAERAGGTDAEIAAKIAAMTMLVDDTIDRVRRISTELRPPVLDRLGLFAAIEWQIEEFRKRSHIHVRFRSAVDQVPLDLGRSTAVFRIFQEALTNIAAHAHATQVAVRLAIRRGWLLITVADNGRGIGAARSDDRQSLGLMGMHERADLLGGQVRIAQGRPRGTVVHIAIPLGERRRHPRDPWS